MHLRHASSLIARIIAIPFIVALVVLLLSDRAPGLTEAGLRKSVAVGQKVEGRTGVDLVDRTDLPFTWEEIGHFGLWAVAAVLAYTLFSRRASITQIICGVFALSATFELAQFFFTSTRQLEWGDLTVNGLGVVFGVALAMIASHIRRPAEAGRSITG